MTDKEKEDAKAAGKPIRRFKLLTGNHSDTSGSYEHGDPKNNVVESTEDLVAKFKNKFQEIK